MIHLLTARETKSSVRIVGRATWTIEKSMTSRNPEIMISAKVIRACDATRASVWALASSPFLIDSCMPVLPRGQQVCYLYLVVKTNHLGCLSFTNTPEDRARSKT